MREGTAYVLFETKEAARALIAAKETLLYNDKPFKKVNMHLEQYVYCTHTRVHTAFLSFCRSLPCKVMMMVGVRCLGSIYPAILF